jgi:hypothetical protein
MLADPILPVEIESYSSDVRTRYLWVEVLSGLRQVQGS